ncbi:YdgA family protein [Castellaniella sp.]|uniref:YdgA family protein n=1 Tax=Castellaniella sp. TaxID=1955812 RepID=UPI0035624AE0
MMRSARWILRIAAVFLLAYGGVSWWAGQQAEALLRAWVDEANQQWQLESTPLRGAPALSIEAYERGVFTSDLRLRFEYPDAGTTRVFALQDHLQHGPWPWQALQQGHWAPLAAYSVLEPVPGAAWQAWFDAMPAGVRPWHLRARIGFGGSLHAIWHFEPAKLPDAGFSFDGAQVQVERDAGQREIRLAADIPHLSLDDAEAQVALEVRGLSYQSRLILADAAHQQAHQVLQMAHVLVVADDLPGLSFMQSELSMDTARTGQLVDTRLDWDLGRMQLRQHDLGRIRVRGSVEHLDVRAWDALTAALAELPEGDPQDWSDAERQKMLSLLRPVFATSPVLALDSWQWDTPEGASEAAVRVGLQPLDEAPEPDPASGVRLVSLQLGVSRPMVLYLVRQFQDDQPQSAVALAGLLFDQMAARLQRQGLVRLADGLVKVDYHFEQGQSVLNGRPLSPAELQQRLEHWAGG